MIKFRRKGKGSNTPVQYYRHLAQLVRGSSVEIHTMEPHPDAPEPDAQYVAEAREQVPPGIRGRFSHLILANRELVGYCDGDIQSDPADAPEFGKRHAPTVRVCPVCKVRAVDGRCPTCGQKPCRAKAFHKSLKT